jgi:hypothetical protein
MVSGTRPLTALILGLKATSSMSTLDPPDERTQVTSSDENVSSPAPLINTAVCTPAEELAGFT